MANLTVVIDPGHYAKYNKGVAPGYYEGDMVWKLSQFLKEALTADGVNVILTRSSSTADLALYDRGQTAVKAGAQVFLSMHSNAIGDSSRYEQAYGVSVYRSEYLPNSEDLGNKLADAIVDVMRPVTGVTYSRGVLIRLGSSGADYYGVIRGAVSGAKSTAAADNGPVKHAFIIEHGFHTNSRECAFLNDDDNLRKIAQAEADVIKAHFGVVKAPEEENTYPLKLTGGTEKDVWDFCKKNGLNDIAAAATCAQARAESGVNSCNLQNSYESKLNTTDAKYVADVDSGKYTNFVKDSAGFGLFQWTYWSRKQGLYDFAKERGVSIGDFQMQLEYFWKELSSNYGGVLTEMKNATDIKYITDLMTKKYESPADQSEGALNKRVEYAKEAYAKYTAIDAEETPKVDTEVEPSEDTVIGTIKVIYEGADGLDIHTTPEWGNHNLNTKEGPVHGGVYRVTEKVNVGGHVMYKLFSGAGYITGSETYVTFTPVTALGPAVNPVPQEIKVGSSVTVLNPITYTGRSFKLYYKTYEVLSMSGDRVVIGKGKVVTCAIHKNNLRLA